MCLFEKTSLFHQKCHNSVYKKSRSKQTHDLKPTYIHNYTSSIKIFYGPFNKVDVLTFLFLCKAILTKAGCQKLLRHGQKLDEMYSKSSGYQVRFPGNKSNMCQDPPWLQYCIIMNTILWYILSAPPCIGQIVYTCNLLNDNYFLGLN